MAKEKFRAGTIKRSFRYAANTAEVVANKSKLIKRVIAAMIVAAVLCGLLGVLAYRPHQVKPMVKPTLSNDYDSALLANLEKLRAVKEDKSSTNFPVTTHYLNAVSQKPDKIYVARQNAPTSMYSATVSKPSVLFSRNVISAQRLSHLDYILLAGEFVHAVLETAIHSDLPGMVRAVVSRPIYAYNGLRQLVPAGSRLLGHYSATILHGQARVLINWDRLILPHGITVALNSPGVNYLGRSGQAADSINSHFLQRFGQSALLSLLSAGVANAGVGNQDVYNSAAQYRMAVSQSLQQSASHALNSNMPLKPTLRVNQGAQINVFVAHDISFYAALHEANE